MQALPDVQVDKLVDFVKHLDENPMEALPAELREGESTLIPKKARPNKMKHLRPIANLPAMEKVIGYRWLQHAINLECHSFQTGILPGCQSGVSAWAVRRAIELASEWGRELVVLQIDLEQAFDRLSHAAILRALHCNNAPDELIKATFQSLNGLKCKVRLGSTVSEWVRQDHGVPQGAPESPAMFVHTTDLIMQELLQQWEQVKQDLFFSVSVGATGERI